MKNSFEEIKCPGCNERLYVADSKSREDPPGVIERLRYLECRHCDYTQKNGKIKDVIYFTRDKSWICPGRMGLTNADDIN